MRRLDTAGVYGYSGPVSSKKKEIRAAFRNAVFERDGHKCRICGHESDLDAHHITDRSKMPNGGYVAENGISLCPVCHKHAELFHTTQGKRWWKDMHPDELYKLIGSNYERARDAAGRLSD